MANLAEFEQIILFSVLNLDDDACGVSIRDAIMERTGRAVSSGAVYTTLGRLEERGLVESSERGAETGRRGRPRKHYSLLPRGAQVLMQSYQIIQAMAGDSIPKLAELAEG
ncbi:MAG: PadR family transcriptional regulator [Acidobacteria bacterium]|nr:PadR family transcriptional regulator [Acidobacteriota bacterium]